MMDRDGLAGRAMVRASRAKRSAAESEETDGPTDDDADQQEKKVRVGHRSTLALNESNDELP